MSSFLQGIQFLAAGSGAQRGARKDKKRSKHDGRRHHARRNPDWINPSLEKRLSSKPRDKYVTDDISESGDSESSSDSEDDDGFRSKRQKRHKAEKKAKKERKKNAKKKSKKHSRSSRLATGSSDSSDGGDSGSEEDERKQEQSAVAQPTPSTLQRDDWMGMAFEPREQEPLVVAKTAAEIQEEQKAKKVQEEIDAGLREPVTGMLYGLFDPKNPDRRSKMNDDDDGDSKVTNKVKQEEDDAPLFGDGGASWRAKMLQRAKEKARETGRPLEDIIQERFGSLDMLKEAARGSARPNAHLHYKRLGGDGDEKDTQRPPRDRSDDERGRRRTLEIGRDASDKVLLAKFSSRVQTAVSRTVGDNEAGEGQTRNDARSRRDRDGDVDDEDMPIDYSKLPDFENRPGARFSAAREDEGGRRSPRQRERDQRRRSRSRDRSRSRGRDCRRGSQRHSRSRERTPSTASGYKRPRRSRSPVKSSTKPTKAAAAPPQPPVKQAEPKPLTPAELEKRPREKEELERRNAFLYGSRPKTMEASPSGHKQVKREEEAVETKADKQPGVAKSSSSAATDGDVDLNKLAAKALRAQMVGNAELFHKLKEQLNELEARRDAARQAQSVPHYEAVNGALPPLEREDLRYGSRKGKKSKREDDDKDGGGVSLEELVRQERMASVHADCGDMDAIHARNILRLGAKYQGSEASARNLASGFDEEDQVDTALLQRPDAHLTKRAAAQRERQQAVGANRKWEERTQKCGACMASPAFKKHLMLALGEHAYLALPATPRLHAAHCVIVPVDHTVSSTAASEQVVAEMRKFQRAVTSMCDEMYGLGVVFLEQTSAPHKQRHTHIECIPVPKDVAADTPLFFRQELLQVDEEWATHPKILDTRDGGVRRHVPAQFAFFHIEWPTLPGVGQGGSYAHVIEDEEQFPRDFGVTVVAGMLGVDPPQYARRRRRGGVENEKKDVLAFLKDWEGFDWTQELDGGAYAD